MSKKTTIRIPDQIYELLKKTNINISSVCRRALENEIYGDNPEYYKMQIKEQDNKIKQEENKKIQLENLYEKAKNQKEIQKKRLISTEPEIRSYRTIIPKKEEGET